MPKYNAKIQCKNTIIKENDLLDYLWIPPKILLDFQNSLIYFLHSSLSLLFWRFYDLKSYINFSTKLHRISI